MKSLHFRLEHAGVVAFGVGESDIETDAGNIHGFAEYCSARFDNFFHGVLYVVDRYDDAGLWRIGTLRIESTVDSAGRFDHVVFVGLCGVCGNIVSHILAVSIHFPIKCFFVKFDDAVGVFVGHFKMDDGVLVIHSVFILLMLRSIVPMLKRRNNCAVCGILNGVCVCGKIGRDA